MLALTLAAVLGFGASAMEGTCLGEKQDQILAQLAVVDDSAKSGKDADVSTLTDYLTLPPEELSKVTRVGITVPLDWECETRDTEGQFPCPNGVPSKCRYYLHEGVTDECVYAYCQATTDECCDYFEEWLGLVAYSSSSTGATPSVTNSVSHNADIPTSPEEGTTVADYVTSSNDLTSVCASSYSHLAGVWGYENWWSYPGDISVNYINFPILRYEFGSDFGLQLYSSNGDAILIRGGDTPSTFKPVAGSIRLPLNESMMATPLESARARRLAEGAVYKTTNPHELERDLHEYNARRTAGSCHPHHGCAIKPKATRTTSPTPRAGRRHLRRGGMGLFSSGSFTMSSSNRAGNSR